MSERYEMNRQSLAEQLCARGYLLHGSPAKNELAEAVGRYQRSHGLAVDHWAGPQTERSLFDPHSRVCGVADHLEMSDGACKWPQKEITWTIDGQLPRLSALDQKQAYFEAWAYWSSVCGVEPSYVANVRTANIVMGVGRIDRGGGTLAWSELPCGQVERVQQKYDTAETWVIDENPQRYEIDLVRVACHEIGHALGIPHIDEGNLMAAAYSPQIRRPQVGDIVEAVKRYGRPRYSPSNPAPGEQPDFSDETMILEVGGRRYSLQVTPG